MSNESRELVLFIDNDGQLYRQQGEPIRINLEKKFKKGTYDHEQAVKLWKYLADNGAKKYAHEFGGEWNRIFSVADRKEAAQEMADNWLAELEAGNFMVTAKTPRAKNPALPPGVKIVHNKLLGGWYIVRGPHNTPIGGRFDSKAEAVTHLEMRKKNPAPRIGTARPRRKSQITGEAPSKRLVKRRRANTHKGYFPNPSEVHIDIDSHNLRRNPIADKIAIHLNAGNDSNGNPRRLFVVVNTGGFIEGVFDEGYSGSAAVEKHYPGIAVVGQFSITPADYRRLIKEYKGK